MADTKISALSDGGNIQATDQVPVNRGGTNARVVVTKAALGLGSVDNTSDATKNAAAVTLTNKTIAGGSNTISGITEAMLSTSDVTTLNASTSKHGFLKKLSNTATEYMDGTGNWSTPAGTGGGGTAASNNSDVFTGDGSTVAFTLAHAPADNKADVSVDGVTQTPTTDYSISGTTITFTSAPANTLDIVVFYSAPSAGGGGSGTVTSIVAGTGLSGGTITTSGTIAIDSTVATLTGSQTLTNKTLTSPTLTTPALGTPSAGVLTSCTGLPVSTGISGLGTGVATALAVNVGSAGAPVVLNGALGTPSSGTLTNCTADGTNLLGYRGVPQNSQTAAYTTVLSDAGKCIFHPSSDNNARTFTIDSNANVAYVVGTVIEFINMAAASVTIAITSDTMTLLPAGTTGSRTLAQYGRASAEKISSTAWIISGNSALT